MTEGKERQKKPGTRRKKALRRTAALLLVAAALQLTGLYGFFPSAGLRYAAESVNCGSVKVVRRAYSPDGEGWNHLTYFGANDSALLIGRSAFYPMYGWMATDYDAVDCSRPGPFHAVVSLRGTGDGLHITSRRPWAFGRVDDPDIQAVEVCFRVYVGQQEDAPVYEIRHTFRTERRDWMEQEGRTYFLLDIPELTWENDRVMCVLVTAYDREGNVVAASDDFRTDWPE